MLFLKHILFGLNQHVFVHKLETGLVQSLSIRTETPYKGSLSVQNCIEVLQKRRALLAL